MFIKIMSISLGLCMLLLPISALAELEEGGYTMSDRIFEAIHIGWNLGNTFDALGEETAWGNPVTTKELIYEIAKQGFKSIRIPVTWKHRMGDGPDYKIDEKFMQRIHEVVDWSLEAGFYVIINLHHDSRWIFSMKTDYDEVLSRFKAAWQQISKSFKDYPPDKLMFESINEPRFSDDWNENKPEYFEMLKVLNTTFYEIVRSSGGNNTSRFVLLPTLTCSTSQERLDDLYKTITELNDRNLIATVHYYGYWPFSVNIAGATLFDNKVQNHIVSTFDRLHNTFIANDIPVIIGEFGLLGFKSIQQGEKLKFFEFITYYAREKKLPLMWWDNGQHFDRVKFNWRDPQLYEVIIKSVDARSSTAETDSIYLKKGLPVEDVRIKLNLNGNELVDIRNGEYTLIEEKDYNISDNTLTIKSNFLRGVVTDKFGVNAVLSCRFSAGAEWKINVIHYDTPILKDMEESIDNFFIPVAFNGAQLKAMEAVYKKSGKNTPPNDWTPFKEYNLIFKPSAYKISLSPDFLRGLEDGEILLKFHFWSGEIIEYTLVKDGDRIKGISSQVELVSQSSDQPDDDTTDNSNTAEDVSDKEDETAQFADSHSSQRNNITGFLAMGVFILVIIAVLGVYTLKKIGHKHYHLK